MQYRFDDIVLDATQYRLTRQGEPVTVEPMVFDLLLHFVRHPGQVFSMDELMQSVWNGRVVSDATISSRIKSARQALGDSGGAQRYIQTVRGRGFRFDAEVGEDQGMPTQAQDDASPVVNPSLLLLPFRTLADDALPAHTGEILAAELGAILTRVPLLAIRTGADGDDGPGRDITPRALYEATGVHFILDGRLHAAGGSIRCNAQLVNARSGFQIWATTLEANPGEPKWLERLVHALVSRLESQLLGAIVEAVRSGDGRPTAALRYLEASGILSRRGWNRDTFNTTIDTLRESCDLDPDLSEAPAFLSLMYALGYRVGILREAEFEHQALTMAEHAMQLDGMNSTVLGFTGCALADVGQVQRSLPILRNAVELNPVNAQAWSALGSACLLDGNLDEAIRHLRHGMAISPLNKWLSLWGSLLSLGYMHKEDLETAAGEALLACQRDDLLYIPRVVLAGVEVCRGDRAQARLALAEARRIKPDLTPAEVNYVLGKRLGAITAKTVGL